MCCVTNFLSNLGANLDVYCGAQLGCLEREKFTIKDERFQHQGTPAVKGGQHSVDSIS